MPRKPRTPARAPKLAGKAVAFVGKFGYGPAYLDLMRGLVAEEGGTVVDGEATAADYLVAGHGVGGKPPAVVARVRTKHPHTVHLDEAAFYRLTSPTAAEFDALLRSGPHGHEFWSKMQDRLFRAGAPIDLSKSDFRGVTLAGGNLYNVALDGSDFRAAALDDVYFPKVSGAKFDGATFKGGSFSQAEDCSLKKITMADTRWNPAEFTRCDFAGAALTITCGSYTRAVGCSFKNAALRGCDLDQSTFAGCDFGGADLTGAKLSKSDFTGANLAGADLTGADLRDVKFVNADLRKATLRDALLSGADLTGAKLDRADFTGAVQTGLVADGASTAKTVGLAPVAARAAGPHMTELGKTAAASKRLTTTIELELAADEYVSLHASCSTHSGRSYPGANYGHFRPRHTHGSYADAPTFEQGMLNLADLFARGAPRFDTVKVDAKQCPLKGAALVELAVAAWHEALGRAVPSAGARARQKEDAAAEAAALRAELLAELTGGKAGVKKWNAREPRVRQQVGPLRRHDFARAALAAARLDGLDFEKASFDGADLTKANLYGATLRGATFAGARMAGAVVAGVKAAGASFAGADLSGCNLRGATYPRADFRGANLTGADFSYADLRGADLDTPTASAATYEHTKFDAATRFPAGFAYPAGLVWKGAGERPG